MKQVQSLRRILSKLSDMMVVLEERSGSHWKHDESSSDDFSQQILGLSSKKLLREAPLHIKYSIKRTNHISH